MNRVHGENFNPFRKVYLMACVLIYLNFPRVSPMPNLHGNVGRSYFNNDDDDVLRAYAQHKHTLTQIQVASE